MAFLEWSEKINLGVSEMDHEHKVLIGMMNELYDLNAADKLKTTIENKFKALFDFTIRHFSDEEAYMEKINYPEFKSHKRIHGELLKSLETHYKSYLSGANTKLSDEVFRFLKVWLQAHIMGIDMKYADFSRKKTA